MKATVFIYQHSESYMADVEPFFRHDLLSDADQIQQKLVLVGSQEIEYERKSHEQLQARIDAMEADAREGA